MKAAVLRALNRPLEICYTQTTLLAYGQLRVRMLVSGICGAQLQEIRGEKGNAKHLPHLLGHEGCGIVEEIGPGVTRVNVGDKVCLHWRKAGGINAEPAVYEAKDSEGRIGFVGGGAVVTLAEEVVVSENRATPVPHDTDPDLAALLGCGLSTALGTIEHEAKLKMGESILIVGCGGLGANLIRCAKLAHATPITCCDIHEHKRAAALALGADFFQESSPDEMRMAYPWRNGWAYNNPDRFDVIVETSGDPSAISDALPLLAPNGRFLMVGHPPPRHLAFMFNADHMFDGEGKTIKATQGGGFVPDRDIPRYVKLWRAGILNIEGIVTTRFPLRMVNEAFDQVRDGNASRVMIDFRK